MARQQDITDSAEAVVIGGGAIGCAIAYHLCRSGLTDVLLLERNELGSGATARAAGLFSHARSDRGTIRMIAQTRADLAELEALLGQPLGFRPCGALRAVHSAEREAEMRAMELCLAAEGLPVEPLTAAEARRLCPWLDLAAARRIILLREDGHMDGARLAHAYAAAARRLGARIRRGTAVTGMLAEGGRVAGVTTAGGAIRARRVIDAAGAWAAEVAQGFGWGFPAAPTRSHYWITRPIEGGDPGQPNLQLPDLRAYFRAELGGLLVGLQEPRSRTYHALHLAQEMDGVPLFDEGADTDLLVDEAARLRPLIPGIDRWQFAHHIAGLTMYTPDGKFVLGAVPQVEGLLVAGGCCGSGLAASGGFGAAIAALLAGRPAAIDLSPFRPDRFGEVTPWTDQFRERCGAARAGKSRGRPDPVAAG